MSDQTETPNDQPVDNNKELMALLESRLELGNKDIVALLKKRLEFGKKKYGHGININEDTRNFGTPEDSWLEMLMEEILDGMFYAASAILLHKQVREKKTKVIPTNELISYAYGPIMNRNRCGETSKLVVYTSEGTFTLQFEFLGEYNTISSCYSMIYHSMFGEQCIYTGIQTVHTNYTNFSLISSKTGACLLFFDNTNCREVAKFHIRGIPCNQILATIKKDSKYILSCTLDKTDAEPAK